MTPIASALSFLTTSYYILAGIVGISILVGFHELGHFLFAKLCGIRTPSFSIGFGPTLIHRKIGDTDFKLSAIPLGGYVEIAGMAEIGQGEQAEATSQDERSFSTKPYYQKMLVLFGGILFNLLFAYLVFILLFTFGMPKSPLLQPLNGTTTIEVVEKGSPAERAQLQAGDIIKKFNNVPVEHDLAKFMPLLEDAMGKEVPVTFIRAGEEQTVLATIECDKQSQFHGRLGIRFALKDMPHLTFIQSIKMGITTTNALIAQTARGFLSIFKRRSTDGVGGPVMIISYITKSAKEGIKIWLLLLALISISLAVLNLFPLPILDGGQILFYTIEAIMGRSLPDSVRLGIHYASWILILTFILYLSFKDVKTLLGFGPK